jgi:hypothetical protein
LAASSVVAAIVGITFAPRSLADATATLRSMIDSARGSCAPLQLDSVLTGVAQRANRESQLYKEHGARFEPFEDHAARAKMLSGYGDTDSTAVRGVVLFGWDSIPDCAYSKYGVDALAGDGYTMATAVLAAA